MSRKKHIGTSTLTGTIFYGTLDTARSMWVGSKADVTDSACRAVAEHLKFIDKPIAYGLSDGGFIILRAEVVAELPSIFTKEEDEV
ncbi:hypothetical protein SAMN05880558_12410 [Aeromonas sp. RU39B]|uniref:DUF7446 family protein n=1 Tax=Aeromonas sp. RU39B TaxID=1907416 RepID=UPI0009544463|nr:hypothetical protein [Aeromonas sp. RU39B]SIR65613.1 hypothetical protein SAMN05880558_12410 [Aeromonas sp. RU39B]